MEKVIYALNLVLLVLIMRYETNSDNDKTIIISSLACLVLVVLNLILGFFAQIDKKPIYRHFYYAALGIVVSSFVLSSIW